MGRTAEPAIVSVARELGAELWVRDTGWQMVIETVVMDEITEEGREGLKEKGLELSSGEFQHLLLCREKRQNIRD